MNKIYPPKKVNGGAVRIVALLLGGAVLYLLAFFALLEGAFNYCVGCKIYGILIKGGLIPRENCPDCA
ncbi:MAG: DUF4395 family protein [Alkalispirochaetaceae bacterium]